jgi:LTXXQ motif family protein
MKKLSRGAWIAIAAASAIPATVAIAKTVEHAGWRQMTPETRARLEEGRLAMAKAALKLSPDQEKLWAPIETQVRAAFKDREAKRADREKMREEREKDRAANKRPDMAERFAKMSQNMGDRAERMKAMSGAFTPFYASLSDEQKDVLRPLVRDLMPGGGGRGHHGPRWAMGGWGPGGGGHHGWGGGHHHGPRGDRGGPDNGAADGPEQGGAPGNDDGAKPADKL